MRSTLGAVRWKQRTAPERFEQVTLWSIYSVFGFVPLIVVASVANVGWSARLTLYLVLLIAHAGAAMRVFTLAMRYSRRRQDPPVVSVVLLLILWALAVGGGIWLFREIPDFGILWSTLLPSVITVGAIAPLPTKVSQLTVIAAGAAAILWVVLWLFSARNATLVVAAITLLLTFVAMAWSWRASAWMMTVVWELDEARHAAGQLAVAEERLRFSRDLHDVFGRTLSTVAVKAELAAALAERGDPRATTEMLEVRQLAHSSMREVRSVAQGYRSLDLDAELAGAQALLRSAGVQVRMSGAGLDLAPEVAEAAAWVVREGVTNVVRHSRATICTVQVMRAGGGCEVRIVNDGASEPSQGGSGLIGLRERLAVRAGHLSIQWQDGTFELVAYVMATPAAQTSRTQESEDA